MVGVVCVIVDLVLIIVLLIVVNVVPVVLLVVDDHILFNCGSCSQEKLI